MEGSCVKNVASTPKDDIVHDQNTRVEGDMLHGQHVGYHFNHLPVNQTEERFRGRISEVVWAKELIISKK